VDAGTAPQGGLVETREHDIIVGYDGSPGSTEALDWAVQEARLRGTSVTVCHAWTPQPPAAAGAGVPDPAREQAERILSDSVLHARASPAPGPEVRSLLAGGPAARVLCEQSAGAALMVVGSHGIGGLPGLQLGSVGLQVAAHAQAPVTVVRGRWRLVPGQYPEPVVVGADGSPESQGALEFAITEAALRDAPLLAVCALCDSAGVLGIARSVEAAYGTAVDQVQAAHPDVVVQRRVEPGAPRSALLTAASRGQLLVVGARGRGGLQDMTLGSITLALLHHAPCPVTVVR
jgi:nucleotide-binding universal stress UspA family protein